MSKLQSFDRYLQQSQPAHLDLFQQGLQIPSMSADPRSSGAVQKSTQWIAKALSKCGFGFALPIFSVPFAPAAICGTTGRPRIQQR